MGPGDVSVDGGRVVITQTSCKKGYHPTMCSGLENTAYSTKVPDIRDERGKVFATTVVPSARVLRRLIRLEHTKRISRMRTCFCVPRQVTLEATEDLIPENWKRSLVSLVRPLEPRVYIPSNKPTTTESNGTDIIVSMGPSFGPRSRPMSFLNPTCFPQYTDTAATIDDQSVITKTGVRTVGMILAR